MPIRHLMPNHDRRVFTVAWCLCIALWAVVLLYALFCRT